MSLSHTTRSHGTATTLPGAKPFGTMSRRAAMLGALTIGGLKASDHLPLPSAPAHAAAVSASADAGLIAHADRLVSLAHRCSAVVDQRISIEDRVFRLCARPAPLPEPECFASVDIDESSPVRRVFTMVKSPTYDTERAAWEKATAAANAAHEQRQAAMEARLGLPEVERRSNRMERRRDRWATDLAAMRPATTDGLGAKAGALLVLLGKDHASFDMELAFRADLVRSVLSDAVRLGAGGTA